MVSARRRLAFWSLRGEGAQRVLHAVAELAQHRVRYVERVLRHEVDAHALGSHQAHHQLDALDQRRGRVLKSRCASSKEEHQLGLIDVTHLGQGLEQLRQHPQQEGGVERGAFISFSAARMLMTPAPDSVA